MIGVILVDLRRLRIHRIKLENSVNMKDDSYQVSQEIKKQSEKSYGMDEQTNGMRYENFIFYIFVMGCRSWFLENKKVTIIYFIFCSYDFN